MGTRRKGFFWWYMANTIITRDDVQRIAYLKEPFTAAVSIYNS